MTIQSASVRSLILSKDENLRSLERSVRRWMNVRQDGEERHLLSLKILKQSHQLVLLEKFLIMRESGFLCAEDSSLTESSLQVGVKDSPLVEGSISFPIEVRAEKLQQVCRVLVSEKMNKELEGMEQPSAKIEKLLVHFYRLSYQMLSNSFASVTILH